MLLAAVAVKVGDSQWVESVLNDAFPADPG